MVQDHHPQDTNNIYFPLSTGYCNHVLSFPADEEKDKKIPGKSDRTQGTEKHKLWRDTKGMGFVHFRKGKADSNLAANVLCRGGGCQQNSEQLFSLVVERTASRNCLDLPVNVRVRRAGAVMQGCSLLLFFSFFLGQVRQSLLGTPAFVSVWGTHAMWFLLQLHISTQKKICRNVLSAQVSV